MRCIAENLLLFKSHDIFYLLYSSRFWYRVPADKFLLDVAEENTV